VIIAATEDKVQREAYEPNNTAIKHNLKISVSKKKTLGKKIKTSMRIKILIIN
jgi:hypothetical protein